MSKIGSPLINWVLRGFQFLFGVVILGLCITLIRGHHWGELPASLGYGAFVGCVTILAALVGIAAVWLEFLDGIISLAVDALTAILNLAGAVFLHIKLKGVRCSTLDSKENGDKVISNDLFNGGCADSENLLTCWVYNAYDNENKRRDALLGHCRETRAAMVFMFMVIALFLASALMGFLRRRRGY